MEPMVFSRLLQHGAGPCLHQVFTWTYRSTISAFHFVLIVDSPHRFVYALSVFGRQPLPNTRLFATLGVR
jgi:hypothetical protein